MGKFLETETLMSQTISISPINSLLFLSDVDGGEPPVPVWGAQILSTSSSISFACYPEQDGPTEVTIGLRAEVNPGGPPSFEGELETPNRSVVVSTVDQKIVLKAAVPTGLTHVCIWLSHPRWPDKITIGLGTS